MNHGLVFWISGILTNIERMYLLLILITFSITSFLFDKIGDVPNWIRGMVLIFSIYLYEPFFITVFGGTIGHNFLKVNVKRIINPHLKINFFQATLRFFTKFLLGWISFLTITGNKRKRAIHDMISGSIMINK